MRTDDVHADCFLPIKHTTHCGRHDRVGAAAPYAMPHAGIVIVGGGPAGYATAIALAQQGYKDILVLERSPTVDSFEPTKTFTYALYPHGKDVLRDLGMRDIDHAGAHRYRASMLCSDAIADATSPLMCCHAQRALMSACRKVLCRFSSVHCACTNSSSGNTVVLHS